MAGCGPRLPFFLCTGLAVRVSGAPETFFPPQCNNRFGKGESKFMFMYSLYLFLFPKSSSCLKLMWQVPFVYLNWQHHLLLQGGMKEQRELA